MNTHRPFGNRPGRPGWRHAVWCGVLSAASALSSSSALATPASVWGARWASGNTRVGDTVPQVALPPQLASITTDTGDFAPGHRDFTHYTTPWLCVAAATTTTDVLRNPLPALLSYDSLRHQPDRDTLPAQARAIARACGAKFTLANTSADDWAVLFDLALLAGDDSLAQAIVARRVATASPKGRDTVWLQTLRVYLGEPVDGLNSAEPARPGLAQALVAQIDRQGDAQARLDAHTALIGYATRVKDLAWAFREAHQLQPLLLQSFQTISADSIRRLMRADSLQEGNEGQYHLWNAAVEAGWNVYGAYSGLARLAYFEAPDSLRVVAELVRQAHQAATAQFSSAVDSVSNALCVGYPKLRLACRTASVAQTQADIEGTVLRNMSGFWGGFEEKAGRQATPLRAAFLFPATGRGTAPTAVRDTLVTFAQGKVTLLLVPNAACQTEYTYLLSFPVCRNLVQAVQRWVRQFGASHVSIVLLAYEYGGSTFLSGAKSPAEEAERIRWYFQVFHGLPVTVAVQEPNRPTLPDGRRLPVSMDETLPFPPGQDAWIEIIDRTGVVRFADANGNGDVDWHIEDPIIAALLRPSSRLSTSATPSSSSFVPQP